VKTIAFFNSTAGVGTTTLVYHLAWMCAELGQRVLAVDLGGLLGDQCAGLVRRQVRAEVLADRAQIHRHRVNPALIAGEHPVLVTGEIGELVDVVPYPFVRGVKQVRAVSVHLDTGLGFGLGVGVAAEVVPALEDEHLSPQLAGNPLGHGQSKEP